MKTLDGVEVKRGDQVIAAGDQVSVIMGTVHELYDRSEQLRVGGYNLRVYARDCVMATNAWSGYAGPLLEARAKAAEPAKLAAAGTPPEQELPTQTKPVEQPPAQPSGT
jgi:hypothetical protein